jgi:hypothetical protein
VVANRRDLDVQRGSAHPSRASHHRLEERAACLVHAGVSRPSPDAEVAGAIPSGKTSPQKLVAVRTRYYRLGLRRPV